MTPDHVTVSEIARVAGLTEKHVRRMISRAVYFEPNENEEPGKWFGCHLRAVIGECGPEVEFSTLPDHIREAFVMLDQQELPFSPPERNELNFINRED